MGMYFVKDWLSRPPKDTAIYGAEWAGTADPSWVRTDAAVGFANPNPYYSGMSTTPSSPFDNIMPWSGMRRVTDASAGELVEIPKFYYKLSQPNGVGLKAQISMNQFDGSYVDPMHMDRGDGVGERDYAYVSRYHCTSDYKSKTGVTPKTSESMASFRTNIHNLGSYIWNFDDALLWTLRLLYLVEFANWNCQAMIGIEPSGKVLTGATDNMPYHTGTTANARSSMGSIQYRHIENLWGNCFIWVDGIYARNYQVYSIINPALFSANQGGVNIGPIPSPYIYAPRVIKGYNMPSNNHYSLLPFGNSSSSDFNTYVCDAVEHFGDGSENYVLRNGSDNGNYTNHGLFFHNMGHGENAVLGTVGARLMVLPPSRLSA